MFYMSIIIFLRLFSTQTRLFSLFCYFLFYLTLLLPVSIKFEIPYVIHTYYSTIYIDSIDNDINKHKKVIKYISIPIR